MRRNMTACWAVVILGALPSLVLSQSIGEGALRKSGDTMTADSQRRAEKCETCIFELSATRRQWCVERNGDHPAWPSRLKLIPGDVSCRQLAQVSRRINNLQMAEADGRPTLVRANDTVAISEENSVLHVRLEGIALSNGSEGEEIKVRLRLSGRVVRVRVSARSKASLIQEANGVRR